MAFEGRLHTCCPETGIGTPIWVLPDGEQIPPTRSISAFALPNFCKLEALGELDELLQKGHDDRADRGHGRPWETHPTIVCSSTCRLTRSRYSIVTVEARGLVFECCHVYVPCPVSHSLFQRHIKSETPNNSYLRRHRHFGSCMMTTLYDSLTAYPIWGHDRMERDDQGVLKSEQCFVSMLTRSRPLCQCIHCVEPCYLTICPTHPIWVSWPVQFLDTSLSVGLFPQIERSFDQLLKFALKRIITAVARVLNRDMFDIV